MIYGSCPGSTQRLFAKHTMTFNTTHHHERGSTVKPAAHIAKPVSTPKTGLFATLGGLFHVKGSGASRTSLRLVLLVFSATLGVLAFIAAPALAAAPETPEVSLESLTATSVTFNDLLNPGATPENEAEAGTYQFLYKKSTSDCGGGSKAPVQPEIYLGGPEGYFASQPVSGLIPDNHYTVCVRAENTAKQASVSTPVTFETPPEAPGTSAATAVEAKTATLHGVLNPINAGEGGTYEFRYELSATECSGPEETNSEGEPDGEFPFKTAPEPAGTANGAKGEAVEASVTGLLPGQQYTYCLLARDEAGEALSATPVTFTTEPVAPTIKSQSEAVSGVEATAATLEAEVDPGGAPTTYRFEYGTTEAYESTTSATSLGATDDTDHPAAVRTEGLLPGTTYHYRVVAENKVGGKVEVAYGPDATFTTSPGPSTIAENCPNKQRRVEQPFGLKLPECRAYELVSPERDRAVVLTYLGGLAFGRRAHLQRQGRVLEPSRGGRRKPICFAARRSGGSMGNAGGHAAPRTGSNRIGSLL
jgi:hypothetical protein